MNETWWKYTATAALSMLLTLGAAYYNVNAQSVTKTEVRDMIQPDRELQRQLLEEVKELRQDVQRMNREIGEIKGMLDRR